MRFLILAATLLAFAAGAPSGPLTPLATVLSPAIAIPAAIPTIPPGDLQAAAINAKVEAEDRARALADQARELAEQAAQNAEDKATEASEEVKPKADEFWNAEEKKWQALDAVNTAQAKLEGSVATIEGAMANLEGAIAGKAVEFAKSAYNGAILVPAPLITPVASPLLYGAPGFIAPFPKIEAPKPETDVKAEKIESPVPAFETKSGLPEGEKGEEPKPVEAKPEEKPASIALENLLAQPLALAAPWPLGLAPIALPYAASATLINGQLVNGQILTPTVLKTQW